MKLHEANLDAPDPIYLPSPGLCIYCCGGAGDLTDEHVIPYALGANSFVLRKSCCKVCQQIIQPYEQEVLKKQLGIFRAQVNAPTRRKKDRPTQVTFEFIEVDSQGTKIRDLGTRSYPFEEAPVVLNLWSAPPPRFGNAPVSSGSDLGEPWTWMDRAIAEDICRGVAEETEAKNVAMNLGQVNRKHYHRALAKTAHAFAVSQLGHDGFEPFLPDIILSRSDDVSLYVGDITADSPSSSSYAHTFQIFLGESLDGPAKGCLVSRIQLYPWLDSPVHLVIVGRATDVTRARLQEQGLGA